MSFNLYQKCEWYHVKGLGNMIDGSYYGWATRFEKYSTKTLCVDQLRVVSVPCFSGYHSESDEALNWGWGPLSFTSENIPDTRRPTWWKQDIFYSPTWCEWFASLKSAIIWFIEICFVSHRSAKSDWYQSFIMGEGVSMKLCRVHSIKTIKQ